MSCAFVVLAHKRPDQVGRLVDRLAPNPVLLHVDTAVGDASPFAVAARGDVTMLPRHRSGWASWGIVAAILEGMRAAVRRTDWSHLMVLSGQDYPLRDGPGLASFLDGHAETSFMARWPLPSRLWGRDGGMHRLRYAHRPVRGRRVFLPLRRRLPRGIPPFGGSMYACLNREAVEAVLAFVDARPDVVRFYRRSWIPDEMFVPTAVMSSAAATTVANESLTFIRWSQVGGAHPDVLGAADLEALVEASRGPSEVGGYGRRKLFARKFDADVDDRILDLLDQRLLGMDASAVDGGEPRTL